MELEVLKVFGRERKAEVMKEAEIQRISAVNQIGSLNRKNEDGVHPLEIFPEVVWEGLLKQLKDPVDLGNAERSCPFFSKLLQHRRNRDILLPQLIHIPAFQRHVTDSVSFCSLRLLSRSVRDAIDSQLRSYPSDQFSNQFTLSRSPRQDDNHPSAFRRHRNNLSEFNTGIKRLKTLYQNFSPDTDSKPQARTFFPRMIRVNLEYNPREHPGPHYETFTKLLGVIGPQILNFDLISVSSPEEQGLDEFCTFVYRKLIDWCWLMPNLKKLSLNIKWFDILEQDLVGLEDAIARAPFPRMEHLRRCHLHNDEHFLSESRENVYRAVLKSNPQIVDLKVTGSVDEFPLEVVNTLQLEKYEIHGVLVDMERTIPFFNFNWSLTHLHWGQLDAEFINVDCMFRFLENFPNLEKIMLIKVNMVRGDRDPGFLNLPNVKEFELRYDRGPRRPGDRELYESMDFLLPMKKLERVKLLLHFQRPRHQVEELIGFRNKYHNLFLSNVWDVFPKLRFVEVNKPPPWQNYQHDSWVRYRRGFQHPIESDDRMMVPPLEVAF